MKRKRCVCLCVCGLNTERSLIHWPGQTERGRREGGRERVRERKRERGRRGRGNGLITLFSVDKSHLLSTAPFGV